jgi:hypothetical protein
LIKATSGTPARSTRTGGATTSSAIPYQDPEMEAERLKRCTRPHGPTVHAGVPVDELMTLVRARACAHRVRIGVKKILGTEGCESRYGADLLRSAPTDSLVFPQIQTKDDFLVVHLARALEAVALVERDE